MMMSIQRRLMVAAAMICVAVTGVLTAAPASAATDSEVPTATMSGASAGGVHAFYAAGKYYYICVGSDGSTWTVGNGKSVATGCRGAEAVQQFLESGQHVWTKSLSPSGKYVHTKFTGTADCYIAIGTTTIAILNFEDSWIWYGTTAASTYGLHSCLSGTA